MYTKILRSKIKYCFETKANLMVFSVIWQNPNTELSERKIVQTIKHREGKVIIISYKRAYFYWKFHEQVRLFKYFKAKFKRAYFSI